MKPTFWIAAALIGGGLMAILLGQGGWGFLGMFVGFILVIGGFTRRVVLRYGGGFLAAVFTWLIVTTIAAQPFSPVSVGLEVAIILGTWVAASHFLEQRRTRIFETAMKTAHADLIGRRAPSPVRFEVAELFWYADVVWIVLKGDDTFWLPPWFYLRASEGGEGASSLPRAALDWMRELEDEVLATLGRMGWRWQRPRIGFESLERVVRGGAWGPWDYFR